MNPTPTKYDRIGAGYTRHRSADPRLVAAIVEQLGLEPDAAIADIGAGSGNYTRALADRGFFVNAVEPSEVMRGQALPHPNVTWHPGVAEAIPLADDAVAGLVCTLAFHHFTSPQTAVAEMWRVCRGPVVILTYDPRAAERFWLEDYFPEIFADDYLSFPPIDVVSELCGSSGRSCVATPFLLPHDVQDLFFGAGWRRPHLYLDPDVRACISVFALADPEQVQLRADHLRADLESGVWDDRYGSILDREEFDAGYRFIRLEPA